MQAPFAIRQGTRGD